MDTAKTIRKIFFNKMFLNAIIFCLFSNRRVVGLLRGLFLVGRTRRNKKKGKYKRRQCQFCHHLNVLNQTRKYEEYFRYKSIMYLGSQTRWGQTLLSLQGEPIYGINNLKDSRHRTNCVFTQKNKSKSVNFKL